MARPTMALALLIGMFLISFLPNYTIAQLKPMCITQFALANQACAVLPISEAYAHRNNTSIQPNAEEDDGDNCQDDGDDNDDGSDERESRRRPRGRGSRQRGRHGGGNQTRRGNPGGHGNQGRRRNRGGRRNRGRQGHQGGHRNQGGSVNQGGHEHEGGHREEPRVNLDCCRWMEEVEEECVCTAMLRLPPFLFKPKHTYDIKVGSTCSRTFECSGA